MNLEWQSIPMPYSLTYSMSSSSCISLKSTTTALGSRIKSDRLKGLFYCIAMKRKQFRASFLRAVMIVIADRADRIQQHAIGCISTKRYHRKLRKEAVRCRQYSSRCCQGYTTKHAGTAKPRLKRERSQTLMKVTGLKSEDKCHSQEKIIITKTDRDNTYNRENILI